MSAAPALTPSQIADLLNFVLAFKKTRVHPNLVKSWVKYAQHRVELWCHAQLIRDGVIPKRDSRLYSGFPAEVQRLLGNRRAA